MFSAISARFLDPPTLRRAAAVVRLRGDVLDRADLEAGGLQRADRRLAPRARALHEHIDLAHAVLVRLAGGVLRGHLRGERGRLAGALEPDVAGGGPGDHVPHRVGDRDDGVVEGALDVRVPVGDVLLLLAPDLLHGPGAGLRRHAVWVLPDLGGRRPLLLAGLLLAGNGLLRALAGARVGLGALPVHRQPAAVPDALVAADLDLAADILGDLAAEVAFDLVVGLDPVAEPRDVVVGHVADPQVRADP